MVPKDQKSDLQRNTFLSRSENFKFNWAEGSQGELIVYQWSFVCRPTTHLNTFSETPGPIGVGF